MKRFSSLPRQRFRRYFQPSRIVLGILPADNDSAVNLITLCFNMHCSYKPPMMAIAIQDVNASYKQIQQSEEYVLAVPGTSLVKETIFCGTVSGRKVDKAKVLGLEFSKSEKVSVPGLRNAVANIELAKRTAFVAGDHLVVIGEVLRFAANTDCAELPLLSVGPNTRGYRILARKGVHRIGTVLDADSDRSSHFGEFSR